MIQILESTQTTGDPFPSLTNFVVKMDAFTTGWFVEWAIDHDNVTDKSTLNWTRYHDQPIQQHGALSRPLIYGAENTLFRVNGGTAGATAYKEVAKVQLLR